MKRVKSLFYIFIISLLLFNGFTACSLFENDVADFMEKYTETAAIEQHSFNVETYKDALNQICIASDEDAEITLLMRNPKQFSMVPSVEFNNLASNYSRSVVAIDQEDTFTVKLSLPQEFLIPVDEGKDITASINLHEPMSGRDFDRYTVNLSCNTKPPLILNPTVMNKGNQVFVVAFDMPNEEEVAVRHKDLAAVEINGVSYPVSVTTSAPDVIDPETPDLRIAHYTFSDPHFKRANPGYSELGGKTFDHNANNSVYFETDDPFVNGDKEYTIVLRDSAGLTSEVKASTSISKLKKPVIKDQNGYEISEYDITVGGYSGIPYNEDTERGVITIYPPTEDHLNHAVSGATVYYRVYEATGSGRIYTSGSTTTAKTLELPQNTYRVEAYASLTNYENSSTTTVKFRFMNNVLYVRACTDTAGFIGDGSALAPYATFEEAIADINDEENRPDAADKFTIYIEGDFTDQTYKAYMDNSDPPVRQVTQDCYGEIELTGTIRTNELVIKKMPTASTGKLKSITIDSTVSLTKVTVGDVTITNNNGTGILKDQDCEITLIIDGANITDCSGYGIDAKDEGTVTVKSGTISSNTIGISGEDCDLNIKGGTISNNANGAIVYGGNDVTCRISGGTITQNGSPNKPAIYIDAGICYITGGSIISNYYKGVHVGEGSTLYLYGGSITGNEYGGIYVARNNYIHVKNNPVVQNNTISSAKSNITLESGTLLASPAIPEVTITIDGPLKAGARIGVTTATEPDTIGETYSFATGYVNSDSPSKYFTSDKGFSIVAGSGGVVNIAKSGSSGTQYLATDYEFEFAASCGWVEPNHTKAITITPTVKRKEANGNYTDLTYNATNKKIYEDSVVLNSGSTVSWSIKIMNGGTQVGSTFTSNSFTFPAVPEGSYSIVVRATYLGQPHSTEIDVAVTETESVSSLSSPPTAATHPNLSISTAAEFDTLATWSSEVDFEGITITLQDDVTVSNNLIIKQFKGTFDGANHKITQNVTNQFSSGSETVNGTTLYKNYMALFWVINGDAVIKNLKTAGNARRAGIVGHMKNGLVENCISETVVSASNQGGTYPAGIVCNLEGGIVRNCINKGDIYSSVNNTTAVTYAGAGIAGRMSGSSIIENCINYGNIGKPDDNANRIGDASGIVGYLSSSSGIIRNCKNFGTIIGTTAAGITALKDGSGAIINCSNHGTVISAAADVSNNTVYRNGGIVGPLKVQIVGTIQNNCNTGIADYGLTSKLTNETFEWDTGNELPAGLTNNFSINSREDALIGEMTYPAKNNFTLADVYANNNSTFTASEATTVKNTLNAWVTTQNQSLGESVYKSWKLNNDNLPEVDLGDLDNL